MRENLMEEHYSDSGSSCGNTGIDIYMGLNVDSQGEDSQIQRLERSLRLLSACNSALVRAKEEQELLQTLCRLMVETGGYRFAWVGYVQQDEGMTVQPVAMAGYEAGYLSTVQITWAEAERGQGPAGKAIRAKQPWVLQNIQTDLDYLPWQAAAQERGYRSLIALPLLDDDRVFGTLNIYAAEFDVFQVEEVRLLSQLAADLSYGVKALRVESDRQQAKEDLRASESSLQQSLQEYSDLVDRIPIGVYRYCMQANGGVHFEYLSPRWLVMNQLNGPAVLADAAAAFRVIHPEDLEDFLYVNEQSRLTQKRFCWEGRLIIGGEVRWMHIESSPTLRENGDLVWDGIQYDITDRIESEQAKEELLTDAIVAHLDAANTRDLLNSVFQRTNDGIMAIDNDWCYTYVNDQAATMLGRSAAELIGKNIWSEFPETVGTKSFHNFHKAVEQQTAVSAEEFYELWGRWFKCRIHPDNRGLTVYFTDITDRKLAENTVKDRERQYASLADAAPVGIFRTDEFGSCTYVNERWSQIAGLSLEQAQDNGWVDGLHPADRQQVAVEWLQATQENRPFKLEYRLQRNDGEISWVFGQVVAELGCDGQVTGYIGTITDITPLKTTEELLRVSEERLRLALTAAKQGLYDLNIQTGDAVVNPEYATMLGYDPATFQANDAQWIERLHPDDRELVVNTYQAYVREEIPDYGVEFRSLTQAGDWKWILSLGKIVAWDENGNPLRMVGTHTDISDLKQAEADRLQAQQVLSELKLLESVLDVVLAGYWDWNFSSQLQYLSPGYKKMLGYEDAELPNEPDLWRQLIFPEDVPVFLECMERHIQSQGKIPYRTEIRYQHKNGSLVWVICSGHVIEWDRDGRAVRMVGCHIDITDRKLAEIQLQQTNEKLFQATQLKNEFLANMSYELRTPLNTILGMNEGLQDEVFGSINARQLQALKNVEISSYCLLELINDLLDVSKIEAGQSELYLSATDLETLCVSSLAFVQKQARKKQIRLAMKLSDTLPSPILDERRIRQVLINLLKNAVKFTPAGGCVTLEVQDAQQDPDHLHISVIDTGIGIAAENFQKLFQPFTQIDSGLNRQYAGAGLGLTLVQRILELHGGQISLTSELGKGSCFSIVIPRGTAKDLSVISTQPVTPKLLWTAPLSGRSTVRPAPLILLAEDQEDNISSISSYLHAKGYPLILAKNGREAIDLTRINYPDLILMDIQMPGVDGIQATQEIRRDLSVAQIPIVALTALAMLGDRERCLAAGATEYLSKPFKMKDLILVMQKLLDVKLW
jgi:PAS domain S-box-containing protein